MFISYILYSYSCFYVNFKKISDVPRHGSNSFHKLTNLFSPFYLGTQVRLLKSLI